METSKITEERIKDVEYYKQNTIEILRAHTQYATATAAEQAFDVLLWALMNEKWIQLAFAEKEDKSINDPCPVCSNDYHQDILSYSVRYHTSSSVTSKPIETKFCPNCGRKLNTKEINND